MNPSKVFRGSATLTSAGRLRSRLGAHLNIIFPDDRLYRAIALAGATFDAKIYIDMRLRLSLGDCIAFTTGNASPT